MDLKAYLTTCSARTLAEAVGLRSVVYLRQIASGVRQPSTLVALRIEAATQGAVTVEELRPDEPWHIIRGKAARCPHCVAKDPAPCD